MRVSDYAKAISVGKAQVGMRRSVWSVISARLLFGIGPSYHSAFRLFGVPASEWRSYVSEAEVNRITGGINGNAGYQLARSKTAFYRHCAGCGIPTVPILGEIGGMNQDGIQPVSSIEEFESLIDSTSSPLFFKVSDGAHGDGAFRATRFDGNSWSIKGIRYSARELYEFVLSKTQSGHTYLIQPAIRSHEELLEIMPDQALGTVRILTWLQGGEAKALQPVLRIPANGNVTDNFSLGLLGNLVAPIDLQSGRLGMAKGSRRRDWPAIVDVPDHPDTGARIAGRKIPLWRETVDLALDAQKKTPQLPTVGWDIAITDDGPLIVEANTLYGVGTFQVAHGHGARGVLAPICSLSPLN